MSEAVSTSMGMMDKGMKHLGEVTIALSMLMMGYYASTEINQSSGKKLNAGYGLLIVVLWVVFLALGVDNMPKFMGDKPMIAIGISVALLLGGLLVVLLTQFL